jgi:hypothetical protein
MTRALEPLSLRQLQSSQREDTNPYHSWEEKEFQREIVLSKISGVPMFIQCKGLNSGALLS